MAFVRRWGLRGRNYLTTARQIDVMCLIAVAPTLAICSIISSPKGRAPVTKSVPFDRGVPLEARHPNALTHNTRKPTSELAWSGQGFPKGDRDGCLLKKRRFNLI